MTLKDAIYELLGIPLEHQPADYYRLLGLVPFESNTEVIANAASRQMLFVRQLASGPYSAIAQDLLDLLSEAKVCLLNTRRRNRYDAELRQAASEGLLNEKLRSIETARVAALPAKASSTPINQAAPVNQSHPELGDPESVMLSASVWQQSSAMLSQAEFQSATPPDSAPGDFISDSPLGNAPNTDAHANADADQSRPLSVYGAESPADSNSGNRSDEVSNAAVESTWDSSTPATPAGGRSPSPARRNIEVHTEEVPKEQAKQSAQQGEARPAQRYALDTCILADEPTSSRKQREWVIGAATDCDMIVRCPYVSRRHCRITESGGRFWVEDLGSRNGTRVNRQLLRGKTEVTGDDLITLGRFARMPWPAEVQDSVMQVPHHQDSHDRPQEDGSSQADPDSKANHEKHKTPPSLIASGQEVKIVRIGRSLSNEVVLNHPSVSRRHAQLTVYSDYAVLEDFGSTNGTFVGNSAMRINRRYVKLTDLVRVGRFTMPVSQLLHKESVA